MELSNPLRTTNPSEWTALDGTYIDEMRPPGRITTRGSAVVAIVGQFQMGPNEPTTISGSGHLLSLFGSGSYTGFKALMNKRFSNLIVTRIKPAGSKAALGDLMDSAPAASITCEAIYEGIYGNVMQAKAEPSVVGGATKFKLTAIWGDRTQVWDNLDLTSFPITGEFMKFKKATGATAIPDTDPIQTITLTQGSDGTVADADYTAALILLESVESVTVVFTDRPGSVPNLALISHCNKMGNRIPILHEATTTTKTAAITAVGGYRGAKDRGILAWPWLYQYNYETSTVELSNPAAWVASVISMIPEEWDPAVVDAAEYLNGVLGLEFTNLVRQDYIDLKNAGIMAFEKDDDYGYKIKSGITVSTDETLSMVFRRRMCDLLTTDIGRGLKPYQNKIMTEDNMADCIGAVTNYLEDKKTKKRILDYQVDGESMNTPASMANGEFHILAQVRIHPSMRHIVLHAEVGESVVINEL